MTGDFEKKFKELFKYTERYSKLVEADTDISI